MIEGAHWAFGAGGGAAFGALPRDWRRHRWAGPVYGLLVWLSFELGIAPALGLSQASVCARSTASCSRQPGRTHEASRARSPRAAHLQTASRSTSESAARSTSTQTVAGRSMSFPGLGVRSRSVDLTKATR